MKKIRKTVRDSPDDVKVAIRRTPSDFVLTSNKSQAELPLRHLGPP